ncbi:MAG: folate family ECF transporter S component [Erysipelotrichaceae bacterium]|jgi:ECF transporter S component (folate family)|nr:folate family ECF transporter S component [Erysipelotrichaceae bacterium]
MFFTKEYWKSSAEKLRSTKYLAIIGLFIAMKVVISFVSIRVSENLYVSLSFLFTSVEGAIIGPVASLVSGAITDVVGYMVNSRGYSFFPGYTLSAMLGVTIYALFLYRRKITIAKLAAAKFINNYFVNVALGSVWSAMMMSKGYIYYATQSLIKNSILLPFEIIALVALFNMIIPTLQRQKLIVPQDPLPLKLFAKKEN